MASGRPRQPNDPSIMASVETAVSTVARPGLIARLWHWRYELGLIAGLVLGDDHHRLHPRPGLAHRRGGGDDGHLAAAMIWPPSRQRIIARAWCVITPHRVRTGCARSWIQTRDGRLPVVLYTVPADFGERVWLWCRAGITAGDLEAARDILRAACWASDVRVVVNDRRSHIVVLEVIRRLPPESPADGASGWPYLDRGEAGSADPEEPALYSGLGHPGRSDKKRRVSCPRPPPRPVPPSPSHGGRCRSAAHRTGQQLGHVDDFEGVLGLARALLGADRVAEHDQAVRAGGGDRCPGTAPRASSMRSVLIRLPMRSSIHIRAPPAPQQKPRFLHRCISLACTPGTASRISRGGV